MSYVVLGTHSQRAIEKNMCLPDDLSCGSIEDVPVAVGGLAGAARAGLAEVRWRRPAAYECV